MLSDLLTGKGLQERKPSDQATENFSVGGASKPRPVSQEEPMPRGVWKTSGSRTTSSNPSWIKEVLLYRPYTE